MFATGTNLSIVIDFLAPVKALARHETGTRPARTGDLRFEAELVNNVENKMSQHFFHGSSSNLGGFCDKSYVDVSLSGSGMGYFSLTNAEECSGVEVILNLESINVGVTVSMVIMESGVSADAESPGFWLR